MLQSFISRSHHPPQKDWRFERPYATLMYKRASTPPDPLGILTYADIQWTNLKSGLHRTFFGNSYTASTSSLHTIQLMGLGITKAFGSLLCSATSTISLPVSTHNIWIFLSLWMIHTTYVGSFLKKLKEQVMYCKGAHRDGQLFHRGKLLTEVAALSKMPCLIVDLRSRVRP
jgi:hypothetical protein